MTLGDFIGLFDEKAIADGKVAFTFHMPKSGKWNFWAEENEASPKEKLIESVMKIDELAEAELEGFEEVSLEPWGEDDGIRVRIHFD